MGVPTWVMKGSLLQSDNQAITGEIDRVVRKFRAFDRDASIPIHDADRRRDS